MTLKEKKKAYRDFLTTPRDLKYSDDIKWKRNALIYTLDLPKKIKKDIYEGEVKRREGFIKEQKSPFVKDMYKFQIEDIKGNYKQND